MKYLIFNLKSKLNYLQIKNYSKSLLELRSEIIIAPTYIYLNHFNKEGFITCAQDVSKFPSGNYTGEVNAEQLKNIGCQYIMVGHYERRKYFKEKTEDFILKIKQALFNDLKIIYCIGETLEDKNNNLTEEKLISEIKDVFDNFNNQELRNIIIAYEPFWMINSQEEINYSYIEKNILSVRDFIAENYNLRSTILYGGSVNSKNVKILKNLPVAGYLIGNSSTSIDEIFTLLRFLKQ